MSEFIKLDSSILVAGNTGLLGSVVYRKLKEYGYSNVHGAASAIVDFTNQEQTRSFIQKLRPDYVFITAAIVGGIQANRTFPADFIYNNLMIECNIIQSCADTGCCGFMFFGSSCMYPRICAQPMPETALMTGPVESTSAAYALAKLAGMEMARSYRLQYKMRNVSVIPSSLYGPGDNFDPSAGHLLSSIIYKYHKAKIENQARVVLWGSGTPIREFLYVDDAADAAIYLMKNYDSEMPLNLGYGQGFSVKDIARIVAGVIGFEGETVFDSNMPDGSPCKVLDSARIRALGWKPNVSLEHGVRLTYNWFINNFN